jgi:hypothetical protein
MGDVLFWGICTLVEGWKICVGGRVLHWSIMPLHCICFCSILLCVIFRFLFERQ